MSEYTTSNEYMVWWNAYDSNGYSTFLTKFKNAASNYENSNYTVGSRIMGYDNQTLNLPDGWFNTMTASRSIETVPSPTSGVGEEYGNGIRGDTLYLKDYQLVSDVYKNDTSTYGSTGLKAYSVDDTSDPTIYCLASRYYTLWQKYNNNGYYNLGIRSINRNGTLDYNEGLYHDTSWHYPEVFCRIRPILTFKSGLKFSNGEGTKAYPFILQ